MSELASYKIENKVAVINVALNLTLNAGTYWLDWQTDGSGTSGPWAPPITIEGITNTGNALRSSDNGLTFQPILDTGLNTPLGLPFILRGSFPPPVPVSIFSNKLSIILLLLMILFSFKYAVRGKNQEYHNLR